MNRFFRPCVTIAVLFLLSKSNSFSQNASHYAFSTASTASLTADKNGNPINMSSAANLVDNGADFLNAALQPIGFDFLFMGKSYTHFIAGNNGQLGLTLPNSSDLVLSPTAPNDLTIPVTYPPAGFGTAPVLAVFWDNLRANFSGPTIRTMLVGTAPNRCRVIEWNVVINANSTTATQAGDGKFQLRMYETTGEIEYVYGLMQIGTSATTVTSSIGFSAGDSDDQFLALRNLSTFDFTTLKAEEPATQSLVNSSSPGAIAGLNSTADGSRRHFLFVPPLLTGNFSNQYVSDVTTSTEQLQWTDNFSNEIGYTVLRSTDNVNFTTAASLPANSNEWLATGLANNTRYYWKVIAFTEGNAKAAPVISDSTRCNMSGRFSIGTGGNFSTIQEAFDTLKLKGMTGNVLFELLSSYTSASEIFPLTFPDAIPCRNPGYQVILRPAAGASHVMVENNTISPLLIIKDEGNIIIDGRAGGIGTAAGLTLSSAGQVVVFQNSSNNTIKYTNISSGRSASLQGAISFEGSAGTGSDNNLIDQCNLSNYLTVPRVLINSSTIPGIDNKNNQVTNSNLYNFTFFGIYLAEGSKAWTIKGNSFYATQSILVDSIAGGMIAVLDTGTSLTHHIESNYFGGTGPKCTGYGMDVSTYSYNVVYVAGTAEVKNNVFRRLFLRQTGQSFSGVKNLINLGSQAPPSGNSISSISNNVFGGTNPADSITLFTESSAAIEFSCIGYGTSQIAVTVDGNSFRNIRMRSKGSGGVNLHVIRVNNFKSSIINNVVGDASGTGSIENRTNGSTAGITAEGRAMTVKNNIVTQITSSGRLAGIILSELDASSDVAENTISYLSTTYDEPFGISAYTVTGIVANALTDATVRNNNVFAITALATAQNVRASGIFVNSCRIPNRITGNRVYSLLSNSSIVVAIDINESYSQIDNNMIRLGLDLSGNPYVGNGYTSFIGIYQDLGSANDILHNTIYLGSDHMLDTSSVSIALMHSGRVNLFNNIISINRSPSSLSNRYNYAISTGTGSNAPYSLFDYNIYQITGPHSFFSTNSNDRLKFDSLQQCRMNTQFDLHSIEANPQYVKADAPPELIDLHLLALTPAEGKGTALHTTSTDLDNQLRTNLSPVDIGADAANFTLLDNWSPVITPDSIPGHNIDSLQTITVKIIDDTGVDTNTVRKPRMWLRRFYPDPSGWLSVPGALTAGTFKKGTWRFTVDYKAIGLPLTSTDSIECYFVASDLAASLNIGYAPMKNNNHSSVTVQHTAPNETYRYKISGSLPDTLFVGSGQPYLSLTNNLGAFQAINAGTVGAHGAVVVITSDLNESGEYGLKNYPVSGTAGMLKIVTNTLVVKNISSSEQDKPLIVIDGSKNVTIDGSVSGSGKYLRFITTDVHPESTKSCIFLQDNNRNITLQNLVVESNASGLQPTIYIGQRDSSILIRNNVVKAAAGNPGTAGAMYSGIYSWRYGQNIRVIHNEISDFRRAGIELGLVGDSCLIDSNHLYMTYTGQVNYRQIGILVNEFIPAGEKTSGGHIISNNYVGGSAPFCAGTPWIYSGTNATDEPFKYILGISIQSSPARKSYVFNNTIQNINITSTDNINFKGIYGTGLIDVGSRGKNIIGDSATANNIQSAASGDVNIAGLSTIGIEIIDDAGSTIANNFIGNITATASTHMSVAGIHSRDNDSSTTTIQNNIIKHLTSSGNQAFPNAPYSVAGMWLEYGNHGFDIRQNIISHLNSAGTATNKMVAGILFTGNTIHNSAAAINISRNRIDNLENKAASGGEIVGVKLTYGYHRFDNNQITITNGTNTNPVLIAGIADKTTNSANGQRGAEYYYNSIYIGGSAASGTVNSHAANFAGNLPIISFKNNLLYNERRGGTGIHVSLGMNATGNSNIQWPRSASDFNFIAGTDTSKIVEWSGGTMDLHSFKQISGGDASSYSSATANTPPDSLFIDVTDGNLNINSGHTQSWHLNGKGLPVFNISSDYGSENARSTNINSGATDIGSDEFTPSTNAPQLYVYGRHVPGGADTLSVNNRVVAVINWANAGTLPTLGQLRWMSGMWPNDTTNNNTIKRARFMSGYWQIAATGGSNYRYSISFSYDSSMLGKIRNASTMLINKRDENIAGSWHAIHPTKVDTVNKIISVENQTSFSEFTATDSLATLEKGVQQRFNYSRRKPICRGSKEIKCNKR